MIKLYRTFIITTILTLLIGLVTLPAMADDVTPSTIEMHATLAKGAAKGYLMSLTQPELADMQTFYLKNSATIDLSSDAYDKYEITASDWLNANIYRTKAILYPGKKAIFVDTILDNGRWKVEAVALQMETITLQTASEARETDTSITLASTASTATKTQPTAIDNGLTGTIVFQAHSGGDIYAINANGTNLRYITTGIDPDLSPDGTKVAFTRWEPEYALYTIDIDGTNEYRHAAGWRQIKSPSWSTNGQQLVFSYQSGGRLEDENHRVNLVRAAATGNFPDVPSYARDIELDGPVLEYRIPMDAHWYLQQIDLLTGNPVDTSTGNRYSYGSNWHPNQDNQIIFRGDRGVGLYDTNAKTTQRISEDSNDKAAVISPDGTKIALSYWQNGHWEVHALNIDGSNRHRLTQTPQRIIATENRKWNNAAPTWSPDSQQIMFVTDRTGEWEFWIMNADGSNQRPMFTNGALDGIDLQYNGVDERMASWK